MNNIVIPNLTNYYLSNYSQETWTFEKNQRVFQGQVEQDPVYNLKDVVWLQDSEVFEQLEHVRLDFNLFIFIRILF